LVPNPASLTVNAAFTQFPTGLRIHARGFLQSFPVRLSPGRRNGRLDLFAYSDTPQAISTSLAGLGGTLMWSKFDYARHFSNSA
jgi:hypothetical protein